MDGKKWCTQLQSMTERINNGMQSNTNNLLSL